MSEKVPPSPPIEVARFIDHLAVERGASRNTLISYRRDLLDFFSRHKELSQENVTEYLAFLRKSNLASSSIARKISSLRSMEDFLLSSDSSRPGWKVDTKSRSRKLPKSISYENVKKLLDAPGTDIFGLRDRAILECLYASGMRVSECISLNLDQFVTDNQGTHFLRVTGKGSKQRLVPIGEQATVACNNYLVRARSAFLKERTEPAFFLNSRGTRLSRQAVWDILKKSASRAGIKDEVTPHTLRHAFATHMLERGADVRSVQELLGHASVVTTQIYTLVTGDSLRETHSVAHPRAR